MADQDFVPAVYEEVTMPRKYSTKWTRLIEAFIASGLKACLVTVEPERRVDVKAACARTAIRRNGYPVRQIAKDGLLYLVRTDMGEDNE